jgi:4a-hydroxytetrahydrobiopterin dehydratase
MSTITCAACRGEQPRLTEDEIAARRSSLDAEWAVVEARQLERTCPFPDFKEALAFANRVGEVAEAEGHHPELHVRWGAVRVVVWTYAVDGLTESDFALARNVDRICAGE